MPSTKKREYDAVVVGSGPNGLAAAIVLQQAGLSVLLLEGKDLIGGGLRSKELTLPGFTHDVCSAIHPLAAASPFFSSLPLSEHGLEFIYPEISAAHPFDDGTAAILQGTVDNTASLLGADSGAYKKLIGSVVDDWGAIINNILGPLSFPKNPLALSRFGLKALPSAKFISTRFSTEKAKGLWAGMAAHSIMPLDQFATAAIGLVLMAAGHVKGWPVPKGGSYKIANALASYFKSIGGKIETGVYITKLDQLPSANAVLFDVTPRQLLEIAGHKFSHRYHAQLSRYQYGMGVFKLDFALNGAVPWKNESVRKAGTVHLGSTFNEIATSEQQAWAGKHPDKPYVLVAQQSVIDQSRAPQGKQALWAYCHVPNGSDVDMSAVIEKQIERYAPGFKDLIIGKHIMNTRQMNEYNPNYIGGDINGGALTPSQIFTRPTLRWSPYRTSTKGIYICSSSTPPGGGVHGMCGYHAAARALKDIFRLQPHVKL